MTHVLPANFFTLVIILSASGCVRPYAMPRASEPHAIVKIRRAYASHVGTTLTEVANIGEYRVLEHSRAANLDATETSAVRVHPGAIAWEFKSSYTHSETQLVREQYYVQEPYTTTETYNCGSYSSSGGSSYRSCTRSVTRHRSVTKYRMVNKQVVVTDAQCSRKLRQLAEVGHVYLLQYSYTENDVCSLLCVEQLPRADGQFDTKPCVVPVKDGNS